jgi:hypothetical protein
MRAITLEGALKGVCAPDLLWTLLVSSIEARHEAVCVIIGYVTKDGVG